MYCLLSASLPFEHGDLGRGQPVPVSEPGSEEQTSLVSWWPKPNAWARGSLHGAWWTPQCENDFFQRRLGHFANGVYIPQRQSVWSHNLKYRKDVKKCWDGFEIVAEGVIQGIIAAQRTPSSS